MFFLRASPVACSSGPRNPRELPPKWKTAPISAVRKQKWQRPSTLRDEKATEQTWHPEELLHSSEHEQLPGDTRKDTGRRLYCYEEKGAGICFSCFQVAKKMQKTQIYNLSGIIQVSSNLSRYSSSLSSFSEYHDRNILKTASRSHGTRWPVSGFRWLHMQQKQFDFRTLKPLSWLLRFCTLRMTPNAT